MLLTEKTRVYQEMMSPGCAVPFAETDPGFLKLFGNFACDGVVNQDDLDGHTRFWPFSPCCWAVRELTSFGRYFRLL